MTLPIEDYAMIGDCETAALVGRDGSIDWLCWPRFDSDACFAALLGGEQHGRWQIGPADPSAARAVSRRYRGDTLILETRFESRTGAAVVIDVMPPRDNESNLLRIVVGERGTIEMQTDLVIRFGYGARMPWVHRLPDRSLRAIAGADQVVLRTPVALEGEDGRTVGKFTVSAGETVTFALSYAPSHLPPPDPRDPLAGLADAEAFWSEWSGRARTNDAREREVILRSLITLKALTYAPTGGLVAAATTSLPEQLGGQRNWDYRYCWLRDATLTLLALMNAGYFDEAAAWRDWLLRAVAGAPAQAQIMYGVAGEHRLPELELEWLPGYEGARPVRIGNAAHGQLQLDVYGEVMDALYQAHRGGVAGSAEAWSLQKVWLQHLEKIWRQPDRSIWESRGEPRHYTLSKVMAWVAFDRGIKLAEEARLEGPVGHWRAIAAEIHAEICAKAYDAELGSFVQSYGSKWLDGSLLLLPTTGFLPCHDPRIIGTVRAIEQRLVADGLVMRHDPAEVETGLAHGEGAFLACSFWLADAMILLGRTDEARRLFDRLLGLRNDVGLLAEQFEVRAQRLVGNFPQAFSHVALVTTANNLTRASKPADQRAGKGPAPGPEGGAPAAKTGSDALGSKPRTRT
ncbi:MAG TPA: glycoside hydrolase family 15 protein [Kofleriaceae bacterium]|nr:glycoside hydrolase family 15 protein [Kofleriaceae bacterium]